MLFTGSCQTSVTFRSLNVARFCNLCGKMICHCSSHPLDPFPHPVHLGKAILMAVQSSRTFSRFYTQTNKQQHAHKHRLLLYINSQRPVQCLVCLVRPTATQSSCSHGCADVLWWPHGKLLKHLVPMQKYLLCQVAVKCQAFGSPAGMHTR